MHTTSSDNEFIPVYVPRRHYLRTIKFLSGLATDDSGSASPASPSSLINNGWTADEVGQLRHMLPIDSTATALFDLTCGAPGKRVSFQLAREHAGRPFDKARADLSEMTKLIRRTWGRDGKWPLNWTQDGSRVVYYASQALADAWNAAA